MPEAFGGSRTGRERTSQACTDGIARLIYQNTGIIIESDIAAIFSLLFFRRSDYHSMPYISSFDFVRNTEPRATWTFLTKGALFLNDDDDAITWRRSVFVAEHDPSSLANLCLRPAVCLSSSSLEHIRQQRHPNYLCNSTSSADR